MADLPNPANYNNWKDWARQAFQYQTAETFRTKRVDPFPVLLPTLGAKDAASVNGLLMFHEPSQTVVVSYNNQWYPVNLGAPLP